MAGRGRAPATPSGHRLAELSRHPELLEAKIAAQAAEIKQLVGDNQRLLSAPGPLREEIAATEQEMQRINAHMRSLKTESDIQVRVLLDKIARSEARVKAGENVQKDLPIAFKEAQSIVIERKELNAKMTEAKKKIEKERDDVKNLPDFRSELESLRQELQILRSTFDYEKSTNIEQVEQLQAMEQKLILMAKEVEKLRVDLVNAEKRANVPVPYAGGFMNRSFPYPSPMQGNVAYVDSYARPHGPVNHQMGLWPTEEQMNRHGSSRSMAPVDLAFPTSGVVDIPPNDGYAVTNSGDAAVRTSTKVAVPASVVASASTSGGDASADST